MINVMLSIFPPILSDYTILTLFVAGAIAGGFINGFAAFGTALFTLGFWLAIMPPLQAVSIIVVSSTVTGLQGLWLVRTEMRQHPKRMARFVLPGILGIPLGIAGLQLVNVDSLKLIIGIFMLGYGLFFMARKTLPTITGYYPVADIGIGFIGGILGGLAALSGALPTFWLSLRDWPKAEIRAVLQPFNVTILLLTSCLFWWQGVYDQQTLILLLISLPINIVSAQFGIMVFKQLQDMHFRRVLISLMFVSGLATLASTLSSAI